MRTQSPKVEMIDSLFKKVSDTEDEGIIRLFYCLTYLRWEVVVIGYLYC